MVKVKVSPEVVRIAQAVIAFVQLLGAGLTGTDVLPEKALVLLVVIGSALAGAMTLYSQGIQTNPPEGMVTEERAAEITQERELPVAETSPAPAYGTYAAGRAPVE